MGQMAIKYFFLIAILANGMIHAEVVDRVAAIVNKVSILESEVERLEDTMAKDIDSKVPRTYIRKWALDRLILEAIQLDLADKYKIKITDEQRQQSLQRLAKVAGVDVETFIKNQQRESPKYLANFDKQLRLDILQQGVVSGRLKVKEEEIDKYLASSAADSLMLPVVLIDIFIIKEKEKTNQAAVTQEILKDIKQGKLLDDLEETYKDKLTIVRNQKRSNSDFPAAISARLQHAKRNDVIGPFASPSEIYIFLVKEVYDPNRETKKQLTHSRHILVKVNPLRTSKQAFALVSQLKKRILAGEDFSRLAQQYSEDTASALDGGNLGLADPNQFVSEFKKTLASLKIDEISDPVRTKFGWHIIQTLDRKIVDTKKDVMRLKATEAIRKRRYQDELALWLHEIRQQAFVKIVDDQ